jgi:hypothetical protein
VRLHCPNINARTDDAYAALCKCAVLDLQSWPNNAAAAATAETLVKHMLDCPYADGVTDAATDVLCSGATMLQRVAGAPSQSAQARFRQRLVLMQLAAGRC